MSTASAHTLARPAAVTRPPSAVMRALPNLLTASRVLMAFAFFGILTAWAFKADANVLAGNPDWLMVAAGLLFIVAVATDALDGYLARRWHTESTFGRIMDPFADKVLVVGAFVFLAGPDFWWRSGVEHHFLAGPGIQLSGVYPWMVVVILARELLVTSIRGVLEARGIEFASDWWGKGKMILQSVVIPAILLILALFPVTPAISFAEAPVGQVLQANPWGRTTIDVLVWVMLVTTVMSGVPYVGRCIRLMAEDRAPGRRGGEPAVPAMGASSPEAATGDSKSSATPPPPPPPPPPPLPPATLL